YNVKWVRDPEIFLCDSLQQDKKLKHTWNGALMSGVVKRRFAGRKTAALKVHSMKHDPDKMIFCLECGYRTKSGHDFYEHIHKTHSSQLLTGVVTSTCDNCGEKFTSLDAYRNHVHPGENLDFELPQAAAFKRFQEIELTDFFMVGKIDPSLNM
uniref:C2H2-type domain-containing protein n=1 Tax=Romanomermis culicivorax TaxID=13658 RepID=A0A915JJE2_ROMCU